MRPYASPLLLAALLLGPAENVPVPGHAFAASALSASTVKTVAATPATPALPAPVLDRTLEPVRRSGALGYEPRPAAFDWTVEGVTVPHEVLAVTVLPGERLRLGVGVSDAGPFELRLGEGQATTESSGRWQWTAPRTPGIVPLAIVAPSGATVRLNVLVAHPATAVREGALSGFRIGSYRQTPLRGDPAYLPPRGFVEVGHDDEDILVSPHFTLGEFLCKQPGLPRFLAVSTPLVLKLEAVLEAANARGLRAPGLTVMSGFRTPWYNRSIGNTTDYSRHLWGDAADVYIDADGDGDMDDLNGDGRVDLADARILAAVVDQVEREGGAHIEAGGVGLYRRNAAHGPFVHVDARGTPARW